MNTIHPSPSQLLLAQEWKELLRPCGYGDPGILMPPASPHLYAEASNIKSCILNGKAIPTAKLVLPPADPSPERILESTTANFYNSRHPAVRLSAALSWIFLWGYQLTQVFRFIYYLSSLKSHHLTIYAPFTLSEALENVLGYFRPRGNTDV